MLPLPEFLAIGHVTRDVHADGTFSVGGTVTFAALTAYHLGLAAGIITSADPEVSALLPALLPSITLHVHSSRSTTTFANYYQDGFRTQYLHARSEPIQSTDIPPSWQHASVILCGPIAQEMSPQLIKFFPRQSKQILAATPQGWLRRWDTDGRVWPVPWREAEQILPALDVLILSHDDLLPFADGNRTEADAILTRWSQLVPILVATDGRRGATLFRHGVQQQFPAYATHKVDPTGAGDVFAAAFLSHLYRHGNPEYAIDFANCVAAFSIERPGTEGIPTLAMIEQRLQ